MTRSVRYMLISFALVILIGAAIATLPGILVKKVPDYLNTHMASFLIVEEASFTRSPPELVLHKVRLKDPAVFGEGDAMRIDRINVVFKDYSFNPMQIASITFHHVRGEYKKRDKANNFAMLLQMLMERKGETPRGLMAQKASLSAMTVYRSSVQNEDGSVAIPLADKEFEPTGAMTEAVPLQHVIADVLGAVIQHEQEAVELLTVENIKEKTKGVVKSISDAFMDYLTKPE